MTDFGKLKRAVNFKSASELEASTMVSGGFQLLHVLARTYTLPNDTRSGRCWKGYVPSYLESKDMQSISFTASAADAP